MNGGDLKRWRKMQKDVDMLEAQAGMIKTLVLNVSNSLDPSGGFQEALRLTLEGERKSLRVLEAITHEHFDRAEQLIKEASKCYDAARTCVDEAMLLMALENMRQKKLGNLKDIVDKLIAKNKTMPLRGLHKKLAAPTLMPASLTIVPKKPPPKKRKPKKKADELKKFLRRKKQNPEAES